MSPEVWSATFAGVAAFAALVTSGVAAWSLVGSRKDSHDRTRPLIVVSLRKGPTTSHGVVYLVIENAGQSTARNIDVSFNPPLPDYETTGDGQRAIVAPILRRRYGSPIPMMAPGSRLKNIYSYLSAQSSSRVEPVEDQFTVSVCYADDHNRVYEDSFPLDRDVLLLETQSNPSDSNDAEKRQNRALEAIVWELWS